MKLDERIQLIIDSWITIKHSGWIGWRASLGPKYTNGYLTCLSACISTLEDLLKDYDEEKS